MNLEEVKQKIPGFYSKLLDEQYSKEDIDRIIEGCTINRKVTLRVNTIKSNMVEIKQALTDVNIKFSDIGWNPNALIIENALEEDIRKLEMYSEGKIYLQSLSSMIPPLVLEPRENEDILDMTAAPRW